MPVGAIHCACQLKLSVAHASWSYLLCMPAEAICCACQLQLSVLQASRSCVFSTTQYIHFISDIFGWYKHRNATSRYGKLVNIENKKPENLLSAKSGVLVML
jgi:glucan phosphoethanolaminetransferase (alkaline phosphatase superfamily)